MEWQIGKELSNGTRMRKRNDAWFNKIDTKRPYLELQQVIVEIVKIFEQNNELNFTFAFFCRVIDCGVESLRQFDHFLQYR